MAACSIVQRNGWAGLTLRPLAQWLNVSVTVLSNHYGTRSEVMTAICRAACADEQRIFAGWHRTLDRLGAVPLSLAINLADTILEELAVKERNFSLLFIELVQASSWDDSLRSSCAPWVKARMQFWTAFGKRAGLSDMLLGSGWFAGYFVDELAYSIVLNHLPAYRMLRRLCLRRLFAGLVTDHDNAKDAEMFEILFDDIGHGIGELEVVHGTAAPDGWPGRAARACATLLTDRGVSGVTHRAIAAQVGVPYTTLSYRFPTQQDLVIAGLEYIISHLLKAVGTGDVPDDPSALQAQIDKEEGQRIDVSRATFAVAVAAARMSTLVTCAADMRRRRGINLIKVLQQVSPPLSGIDQLSAQVMSVGLIGLINTMPPGDATTAVMTAAYGKIVAHLQGGQ